MAVSRILCVFVLAGVLSGCAGPSAAPPSSQPTEDDGEQGNSPLVKEVEPSATALVLHLLAAPDVGVEPVPAGDPIRSPFDQAIPTQGGLSWVHHLSSETRFGTQANWTVWVEVPQGAYAAAVGGCQWSFNLAFSTNRSSSTYNSGPSSCEGDTGPATPGVRRLDGSVQLTLPNSRHLRAGDTITLSVTSNLIVPPGGSPPVALSGAKGVDSQVVLQLD